MVQQLCLHTFSSNTKLVLSTCCLLLLCNISLKLCHAQGVVDIEKESTTLEKVLIEDKKPNHQYSVSYFGNNLWNEGLNFGVEKRKYHIPKVNKRGKESNIIKGYALNLGFYNDTDTHLGAFIVAGWTFKKVTRSRFNLTTSLQPFGLYRSFLTETYKVSDNGDIRKVFLPGRMYFAPSVSAGFGRVGRLNPENGWYTRMNIMTLLPYNGALLPLLNVEFGYHFVIKFKE